MMEIEAAENKEVISDGSEANFMEVVIEESMRQPVIVDFWAPWCGPCKQLTPLLEAAVQKRKGKVKLVKINVDENQGIAAQLRIQSIPTVYAFAGGRPVDAFQGMQSPSELEKFIDNLAKSAPNSPIDDALDQAELFLTEGAFDQAGQYFAAVLAQEPDNLRAGLGLAQVMIELGEFEKAKEMLSTLPKEGEASAHKLLAKIAVLEAAAKSGPIEQLLKKIEDNPNDHQARLEAATALYASGQSDAAIDQLIESFRRDREWNEGAAKAQLIQLFDSMDPKDPALAKGRRKFTSLIFL